MGELLQKLGRPQEAYYYVNRGKVREESLEGKSEDHREKRVSKGRVRITVDDR